MEEENRPEDRAYLRKMEKVRMTLKSMLEQRGYYDPNNTLDNIRLDQFIFYGDKSTMSNLLYFKKTDHTIKIRITFELQRQEKDKPYFTDQRFQELIVSMSTDHIQNLLIIVNGEPSKVMDRKSRDKFDQMHDLKNYTLEFFNIDDLVFDITKHDLVPLHKPINLQEKQELLKKYKITEVQLPRILSSDPVARFLGLKHGDAVKIIRKSETAGVYVTYRIVI